jgi:hypothetical protein
MAPAARPARQHGAVAVPFGEFAADEIARLDSSTTLGAWMAAHADDEVTLFSHAFWKDDFGDRRWCARAAHTSTLADGRTARRVAYFYAPAAPETARFGDLRGRALLDAESRLGRISVEAPELDPDAGEALADATRRALATRLGAAGSDEKIWYFGAADWTATAKWRVGDATVVSAYNGSRIDPEHAGALVFAFGPASGVSVELGKGDYEAPREVGPAEAVEAIAAADLGPALSDPLYAAVARARDGAIGASDASALVDALEPWLRAARSLPPPRRAAALLAADRTVKTCDQHYQLGDEKASGARRRLAAFGARFEYSQLGGWYGYTHTWLQEAVRLDRDGPAGQTAFVDMLEAGFDLTGTCSAGREEFRLVIKRGEPFLARVTDPRLRFATELAVARAHADVVALADGAADDYADAAGYRSTASDDRALAIAHYDRALAIDDVSDLARRAWGEAWRLRAGLPPVAAHFFCIYD